MKCLLTSFLFSNTLAFHFILLFYTADADVNNVKLRKDRAGLAHKTLGGGREGRTGHRITVFARNKKKMQTKFIGCLLCTRNYKFHHHSVFRTIF